MDETTLADLLVKEAEKDNWDNVGRVFLNEFCKRHNVSPEEISKAIERLKRQYEIRKPNDNILLVALQPREKRPFVFPKLP